MARDYGTGAYGGGNYSAMTAGSVAAGAGALVEAGWAAGLGWQARAAGPGGGFGLAGDLAGLRAAFCGLAGVGNWGLSSAGATTAWQAAVGGAAGGWALSAAAAGLAAGFMAGGGAGEVQVAGGDAGFAAGNLWDQLPDGEQSWEGAPVAAASWERVADERPHWTPSQASEP